MSTPELLLCEVSESTGRPYSLPNCHELSSGSSLFDVVELALLSGYDACRLSKGEVARHNISGQEADVGELLRGCEAQLCLRVCVVCLRKHNDVFSVYLMQDKNEASSVTSLAN